MVTDNCNTVMTMPVAPTYGVGGSGGFGNTFGNDGWWIILFFIVLLGGWGGNGYGRYGSGNDGGGGGAAQNYVLASDFATIQRQLSDGFGGVEKGLDTVRNGLCDGFYNNAQLTNGVQMQMANSFAGITQGMTTQGYETRNAIGQIGTQLAQCCCDTKAGIAELKYTVAQGDCATGQAISMAARDIIDSQDANYRALHDEIVSNRIEDKNAQIAALQQQVFQQNLAASQATQNSYLVDKLSPKCPVPAYLTCNPNAPMNYSVNYGGCGC